MKRALLFWLCLTGSLLAAAPLWPGVAYTEVRAFTWGEFTRPRFPIGNLVHVDFWQFATSAFLAGAPLPTIYYQETDLAFWNMRVPDFFPQEWLIQDDMTFVDPPLNQDGALLTAKQVKRLLLAESQRRYRQGAAGCYNPHNAFVFYDAGKKPVAFLEVCFDCLGSRTRPEDAQCDPDFQALVEICAELKLPFGRYKSVKDFRNRTALVFEWEKQAARKARPKGTPARAAGGSNP